MLSSHSQRTFTKIVRMSLPGMFFNGTELSDDQLMKALGRHERRWEGAEVYPSKVTPEVASIVAMKNQPTARDCEDTVYGNM